MSDFQRYNSILNFYRPEVKISILELESVIVEEKVDGSNISFGYMNDRWVINTRNNRIWSKEQNGTEHYNIDGDGFRSVPLLKEAYGQVMEGIPDYEFLIYGEVFGPKIQRRINYGPNQSFVFFDCFNVTKGEWISHDDRAPLFARLGLPMVPEVYRGAPSEERLQALANAPSVFAKQLGVDADQVGEGVIIRGEGAEGRFIAKWKAETFSERGNPKIPKDQYIVEKSQEIRQYITASRLHNILVCMEAEGWEMSKKITGEVVRRMTKDILEEIGWDTETKNKYEKLTARLVGKISVPAFHAELENNKNSKG